MRSVRRRLAIRLFSGLWVTILAGLLLAVDSLAAPSGGGSSGDGAPVGLLVAVALGALLLGPGLFKAARLRKRRRTAAVLEG